MGSDLGHVVTRLSLTDPLYRLWEKEQAVVMLSRTECARDIIFVGSPREIIDAILQVIQIRSQYSEYMNHIISVLSDEGRFSEDGMQQVPAVNQNLHPFCPRNVIQPNDGSGYCYILVSLKDMRTTYIGQTRRLVQRLQEHNSGYGSQGTSDYRLRPWALLAYVSGFDENVRMMLAFEQQWKLRRDNLHMTNPMQIADLGRSLIGDWQETSWHAHELCFIRNWHNRCASKWTRMKSNVIIAILGTTCCRKSVNSLSNMVLLCTLYFMHCLVNILATRKNIELLTYYI